MSVFKLQTISLTGLQGELVEVEVDISDGLPGFTLLGLPDTALTESRDRVRSALVNSGFTWPNRRVIVSLSPAWLPKKGSNFDLPIAIALLVATGEITQESCDEIIFVGERCFHKTGAHNLNRDPEPIEIKFQRFAHGKECGFG